ncbi:dioxygenase, isopenicillin N synthase [Frankia sp. EI5c]|uniref:isopenicillin N synthase family dioxygenase n=1 Tax=Frankia sp. EI5c TaxID=683316 RepID=UPI0007C23537|nr:2-oxoglutarate and iron-dependent oxygenase domain-containing protein [Frankia sp. EI5c]OAA29391.1 dioxygenase, isopenicillin N synthase [Frankia sp. EI5c]
MRSNYIYPIEKSPKYRPTRRDGSASMPDLPDQDGADQDGADRHRSTRHRSTRRAPDRDRPGPGPGRGCLPVLDLRRYTAPARPADRADFLAALRAACRDPGFFQLVGHGVPPSLAEDILRVSREFFRLPAAAKLEIENVHSAHFRGYTRFGHEITRGRPDLREQIDIGDERPPRALGPGDPPYLRLDGPNQWPAALPALRPAVEKYLAELGGLARVLVHALAESLGLPAGQLDATYATDPRSHLKLLRYLAAPGDAAAAPGDAPSAPGGPPSGYGQGVGAHKDGGFLSLVLQDELRPLHAPPGPPGTLPAAGPGLQVADGPGRWIDAAPLPGAFVVNIGEMFELATAGYYQATVHRVTSPPPGHERVSVAFFFGPSLSATVTPVPLPADLLAEIPDAGPPDPDNPIFAQHGMNTLKSWLRSHPEVTRRHYADLTAADLTAADLAQADHTAPTAPTGTAR